MLKRQLHLNQLSSTQRSPSSERRIGGIERLAIESEGLLDKKRVQYRGLKIKSLLNRCSNPDLPFYWTINPYRGCEFGCKYCYARYTHEYMGKEDPILFETEIFNKQGAAKLLESELAPEKLEGKPIAIGTATDPYQPAERRFQTTRKILEVLSSWRGLDVSVTTKSALVVRDLDLLKAIGLRSRLHVHLTITTVDSTLAGLLEPLASAPQLRLEAVSQLATAGITVGVFIMPVLPWITDKRESLEEVVRSAKNAGAAYLAARALFLMPVAEKVFMPFLAARFPSLVDSYTRLFKASPHIRGQYPVKLQHIVRQIRQKYALPGRPTAGNALQQPGLWRQGLLAFEDLQQGIG